MNNNTTEDYDWSNSTDFPLLRQPVHLVIIYCLAYASIFIVGLVGNMFVVFAVALYPNMRNMTNYFILSLAVADMLIIIFCLPATLMNNILNEWWFGNILCKLSVYINGATSCSSVYTLVAVTADRYFAICHTMRYNVFEKRNALYVNVAIWSFSGLLFLPWPLKYHMIHYPVGDGITARICVANFANLEEERLYFLMGNILLAFVIPLVAITVCYIYIFVTIYRHRSIAVDKKAQEREHRVRMRVTNMMLTVILLFAASWLPLYVLFIYLYYEMPRLDTTAYHVTVNILRPCFQLLSLSNSCINPILYAYFSAKFRRAFRETLLLPCRRRYREVQQFARSTVRRVRSSKKGRRPSAIDEDACTSPNTDRTSLYSGSSKKAHFTNNVYRSATIKSNASALTSVSMMTPDRPRKKVKSVILNVPDRVDTPSSWKDEESPLRRRKTPHPGPRLKNDKKIKTTHQNGTAKVMSVQACLNKGPKKFAVFKWQKNKSSSESTPGEVTENNSPMNELVILNQSPGSVSLQSPKLVVHPPTDQDDEPFECRRPLRAPIITMQELDRFSIASSAKRSICSGDGLDNNSSRLVFSPTWCPHKSAKSHSLDASPLCRKELKLSSIDSSVVISNPSADEGPDDPNDDTNASVKSYEANIACPPPITFRQVYHVTHV